MKASWAEAEKRRQMLRGKNGSVSFGVDGRGRCINDEITAGRTRSWKMANLDEVVSVSRTLELCVWGFGGLCVS